MRASGLAWTILKPPRLTNGRHKGRARIGPDLRIGLLSKVSRADLAEVILDEIERSQHIG